MKFKLQSFSLNLFLLIPLLIGFVLFEVDSVSAFTQENRDYSVEIRAVDNNVAYLNGEEISFEISITNNSETNNNENLTVKIQHPQNSISTNIDNFSVSVGEGESHKNLEILDLQNMDTSIELTLEPVDKNSKIIIHYVAFVTFESTDSISKTVSLLKKDVELATSEIILEELKLTIEEIIAGPIQPDGQVNFRIILDNKSLVDVPNIQIKHELFGSGLPVFLEVEMIEINAQYKPLADQLLGSNQLVWMLEEILQAQSKLVINYVATIEPDFKNGNDSVSHKVSVLVGETVIDDSVNTQIEKGEPNLELKYSLKDQVFDKDLKPGDQIEFTLEVENIGVLPAQDVIVTADFDSSIFNRNEIGPKNYLFEGSQIQWKISELLKGDNETFTYYLTIPKNWSQLLSKRNGILDIENTAKIWVEKKELDPITIPLAIRVPILNLDDISTSRSIISGGDNLILTFELENVGAEIATDLKVIVTYDSKNLTSPQEHASEEFVEGRPSVFESIPKLEANQTQTVSFEFKAELFFQASFGQFDIEVRDSNDNLLDNDKLSIEYIPSIQPIQSEHIFGFLIGLLIIGTLLVVGFQSQKLSQKDILSPGQYLFYRDIIEIVTVVVIVSAVLLLGFTQNLKEGQALTVLSGIAGYVLGRHGLGPGQISPVTPPTNSPNPKPTKNLGSNTQTEGSPKESTEKK